MLLEVDLIEDVVLLINRQFQVVDGFEVRGATTHQSQSEPAFYTYRSLLTPVGACCLCGRPTEEVSKPCISSGGYHAFPGLPAGSDIDRGHRAEQRNLPLHALAYDEFVFYVEHDNLFPIGQIQKGYQV